MKSEKDRYDTLICGLLKKTEFIETGYRLVAARGNQGEALFHIGEEALRDTNFDLQNK